MNGLEAKMVEILRKGKEKYGFLGVKAEFEAEGTRTDELLRLIDIVRKAGVKMGLKIGGCEAIRDLIEAKQIGVDYIIAPMIESPYALLKYIEAKNKVYDKYERTYTDFLFNLETKDGYSNINEIIKQATVQNGVKGIVFGRTDYTTSKGLKQDSINQDIISRDCIEVAKLCKSNDLEFIVGGGISKESLSAIREINKTFLTRFETRKIIFSSEALNNKEIKSSLDEAVSFELLWLKNKQEYYSNIMQEDMQRIQMLEKRINEVH